jgi:hypothetical protein
MSESKKDNNQISLKQAKDWTAIWRIANPNKAKAYLIPIEDLMGVLIEMEVLKPLSKKDNTYSYDEGHNKAIRGYMAIEPVNLHGRPEEKLLIVGTEKIGEGFDVVYRDIIWDKNKLVGDGLEEPVQEGDGSGVFDFSRPCPDRCDEESPLNG